jgi:hypothetical protein
LINLVAFMENDVILCIGILILMILLKKLRLITDKFFAMRGLLISYLESLSDNNIPLNNLSTKQNLFNNPTAN